MKPEIMIGLEVHIHLDTTSKLFCGCPTSAEHPNSATCVVCLGHPGSKPVPNKKAIEYGAMLAIALGAKLAPSVQFSRKTYFYPDMSKNYQITQYEIPLATGGQLLLDSDKAVTLKRIHIEEDPAALVHEASTLLVDYNRSGIPLLEVVTEPVIGSPAEAREFMNKLITVLDYLNIFDVSGIIKADANVSIKATKYTRVEVKNITGFKEIERALIYEVQRQQTQPVKRETRGWNAEKGITFPMREKEFEEDYGYIIDPDLTEITLTSEWLSTLKKAIPELAHERAQRFVKQFNIDRVDAQVLCSNAVLAGLFEYASKTVTPVLAARWLRREFMRVLNSTNKRVQDFNAEHVIGLLELIDKGKITDRIGQELMEKLGEEDFDPKTYIKEQKLGAFGDEKAILTFCKEVVKENPKAVADVRSGEEKAFNFLVGKVMAKTKGKAPPDLINKLLKRVLK